MRGDMRTIVEQFPIWEPFPQRAAVWATGDASQGQIESQGHPIGGISYQGEGMTSTIYRYLKGI